MGEDVEVIDVETLPAVQAHEAVIARGEITVEDLVAQADKIQQVMERAMRDGVHYGRIPGIDKPTLLKPGAEMLCVLLRLAPSYLSERMFEGTHLTVVSKATLTHIPTGYVIAEGEGLCSTRETKYAYRQGKRTCPDCGAEAIVRSGRKSAYYCISNEGGCGHRFNFGTDKAKALDDQDVGRVDNPDVPDTWNTVLKMADKRALVAAVLNGTAASDVFTQDVEDQRRGGDGVEAPPEDRPFDPSVDLLPGAIRASSAKEAVERLIEALVAFNADVDWPATLTQLEGDRDTAFLRRLANAVEKVTQETAGSDMVPDDVIVTAFAWAFSGQAIALVAREQEETEVVDGD